jgi:pyridoxal phosphate enzyme (YggS family)
VSAAQPPLAERLAAVQSSVADAAREAGREPAELTTIVVTKFHPASLVRELFDLGVRHVGENRQQEASDKSQQLADLALDWHFIGQLQSKKARSVLAFASTIHSLDRISLVTAIGAALDNGAPASASHQHVDAFIQVNLTDDAARGGVRPDDLASFAEAVAATPSIALRGLMAVAPVGEDPRRAFERVRRAQQQLLAVVPGATDLSMGMSGDFREAVLEGATHLRIGTAITGNRPTPG